MVEQKQIDEWKKIHGEIVEISVKVGDKDIAKCYLKPADGDRTIVSRGLAFTTKGQLLEAGEFVLNNCWLGGDERCKDFENHGKIAIAAAMQASQSVDMLEASQKKI